MVLKEVNFAHNCIWFTFINKNGTMEIRKIKLALWIGMSAFFSCKDMPSKTHGPIRLGDSSTIVTETDPALLQDIVTDLKPVIPVAMPDTPKQAGPVPAKDTARPVQVAQATPAAPPVNHGPGLKAEFKEVTVSIPGLTAKLAGKGNLQNANGAVYTWEGGNINGNVLYVTGGTITKVSQRYQSIIVLHGQNGNLPLDELTETTGWAQVKGNANAWPITGLTETAMEYADANSGEIKSALMKAAKARRLSHKKLQEWQNVMGNVRSANQKPLYVTLRSVMWKIDGKDAQGKIFSKQIRVDVPF